MSQSVLEGPREEVFRAVAETVAPGARGLDDEGWSRARAIVEGALADRPAAVRRQLGLFLVVLRWLPALRWGRTFPRLDPQRRRRTLAGLQDAPLLLLRRGAWGVRTLAFMAYYGLPEVRRRIGYGAHPGGWAAHGAREEGGEGGAWPEGLEPGPEVQL